MTSNPQTNPHPLKSQIESLAAAVRAGELTVLKEEAGTISALVAALDQGELRVAYKDGDSWHTQAWVKEGILLYFRLSPMQQMEVGPFTYNDKIPLKKNFAALNVRVVPPATARFGSFMEAGVVLMPSYVNIGAYVGKNSMVDTWATVGSCAQIGANVHLSGGVGIGGVLEPPSASPVIVEDGAFIGSRSILVEGVRVGKEAVLAANTTLTASTPIIDLRTDELKEMRSVIPPRCVVVPGTREKTIRGHKVFMPCAYIIGERTASTDLKTSLNETLREFSISV